MARFLRYLGVALLLLVASAVAIKLWPALRVREVSASHRSLAAGNLRQIGIANLIYASDHGDKLAVADNIWDYAGELARGGGLNDATVWTVYDDPANRDAVAGLSTVLTKDRSGLAPAFRRLAPSWAVALGPLQVNMPSTMPIAWTRGLRPDGTWSPHSPYGAEGGHVVFLGGHVVFYRSVVGELLRFDGKGKTSNILEALPPGTRIGEYEPNEKERGDWAREGERRRRTETWARTIRPMIPPVMWAAALTTLIVQAARRLWPVSLVVWFLVLSGLAAILMPTVS